MNKTQKITVFAMAVFAAVMIAGPIALNFVDSAHAIVVVHKGHHHHGHFRTFRR